MKLKTTILFYVLSLFLILGTGAFAQKKKKKTSLHPDSINWTEVNPVEDTQPSKEGIVKFTAGEKFVNEKGKKRRDPSDVILVDGVYYVYYTYLEKKDPGFPEGWGGRIWYATSKDGHKWEEQGEVLGRGEGNVWDGTGVYTPNILEYKKKYYLSYTAMPKPFKRGTSKANISVAVADSPKGPFKRISDKPLVPNSDDFKSITGFLVDDSVMMVRDGKVFMYHKGFPAVKLKDGRVVRNKMHSTYMTYAVAKKPEGPYKKLEEPLTRAHEVIAWNNGDNVESFTIGWGDHVFYQSEDGKDFKSVYALDTKSAPNHLRAAGFFRSDLTGCHKPARPTWGVCMSGAGLQRFDIVWPEE